MERVQDLTKGLGFQCGPQASDLTSKSQFAYLENGTINSYGIVLAKRCGNLTCKPLARYKVRIFTFVEETRKRRDHNRCYIFIGEQILTAQREKANTCHKGRQLIILLKETSSMILFSKHVIYGTITIIQGHRSKSPSQITALSWSRGLCNSMKL